MFDLVLAPVPTFRRVLGAILLAALLSGCETEDPPANYVARVDNHYLTQDQLNDMLKGLGPVPDSTEAREQVIEQWVEQTLLYREAQRLNLSEDPDIEQRLKERRRNTLVSALQNRIHEEMDQEPSDEEIRTYFERHQDQLTIREPYVRIRHLATASEDTAQIVREELVANRGTDADSLWARLTRQYASSPSRAHALSERFYPEGRLFDQLPYLRDELSALREGEVTPVTRDNNQYHVLQLVRRIPEGTEPELQWMEDEIRRRLRIRNRKQMYAREVQRLRTRARADDLIEIP